MIYPIYIYGHPVLRKKASDISRDDNEFSELINNLFDTMYKSDGIGLAAPQVGILKRVFVVDGSALGEDEPELAGFKQVFMNARIKERTGEIKPMNEGCLSIPNLKEEVDRESTIRIEYWDENWNLNNEVFTGYKARIIQHEYDHLDGILFTDKVSPIRKHLLKGKLNAISRGKFDVDYKTILPNKMKK